jgi:hypothetical protein
VFYPWEAKAVVWRSPPLLVALKEVSICTGWLVALVRHQANLKGTIILDNGISRYIWDYNPLSIDLWWLYRIIVTFKFP